MDPNNQTPSPIITPPDQSESPASNFEDKAEKQRKIRKIVLIAAGATILILTIVGIVASLSGGDKKKQPDTNQTTQTPELTRNPTAIDIESVNNSINSSITGLNDEQDFPASNLDDKNLGL